MEMNVVLDSEGRPVAWSDSFPPEGSEKMEVPDGTDLYNSRWDGEGWVADGHGDDARAEEAGARQRAALAASQVRTAAEMFVEVVAGSGSMLRRAAVSVSSLIKEWSAESVRYGVGQWTARGGDLYRVETAHTSQESWKPEDSPSLFTRIRLAPDGVRVWEQPTRAEDSFDSGELCHYPDSGSGLWASKIDGNAVEPGTDDRYWEEVAA